MNDLSLTISAWNFVRSISQVSRLSLIAALALTALASRAFADDAAQSAEPETYSLHGQFTLVDQYHPSFTSPYRGQNSLDPGNRGNETADATLFAGVRLWKDIEFYVNPEVDQGFGISNTLGVAGFTSGEAYKVGQAMPYIRIPRAFFRRHFALGGDTQEVAADQNQLGGTQSADDLTLTVGKFSVVDIFDTNRYAHDPKGDFFNWAIVDAGAFDYAADAWGYSYGAAGEWTQSWWTLRGGIFDLSRTPNSKQLTKGFGQFELVTEAEERHELFGKNGKLKLLFFVNRGQLANYNDAIRAAAGSGSAPDVALIRRYSSKPGMSLNFEQEVTDDVGIFARLSASDGHKEAEEFTEINRSASIGLSLTGTQWGRKDDTVGLAGVVSDISHDGQRYFALGGLGILIGDGRLPHPGLEQIIETYYSLKVIDGVAATFDYQFVDNPGYNRDRGPVSVFGARLHSQF